LVAGCALVPRVRSSSRSRGLIRINAWGIEKSVTDGQELMELYDLTVVDIWPTINRFYSFFSINVPGQAKLLPHGC
jgi:hypothetical protein